MPPRVVMLAACLTVYAGTGAAETNLTGNQLLEACGASNAPVMMGYCIGYARGALEGIRWGALAPFASAMTSTPSEDEANALVGDLLHFCLPTGATSQQIFDVFLAYLERNPETRHESARVLMHLAMIEAFPCQAE